MGLSAPERRIVWAALVTVLALLVIALLVLHGDVANRVDVAISAWLLELRNPQLDSIMVMITMFADSRVLTLFAVTLVVILLCLRAWGLAMFSGAAVLGNFLLVPWLKERLQRARPGPLSIGADSYSFPSGHAAMSTVVIGIAMILVGSGLSRVSRNRAYAGLALVLLAIAFSRVYLQVHWSTDVVAGVLLGGLTVLAVLFALEQSDLLLPGGFLAVLLISAFSIIYLIYLYSAYPLVSALYLPD